MADKPYPGQQWKCGDEWLPFHPQASHVPPEYRDGWNCCFARMSAQLHAARLEGFRLGVSEAAKACAAIEVERWAAYKDPKSTHRGVEYVQGQSDGAAMCERAVDRLRLAEPGQEDGT